MDEGERKMKCGRGRFAGKRWMKGIGEERSWERDCEIARVEEREREQNKEGEREDEREIGRSRLKGRVTNSKTKKGRAEERKLECVEEEMRLVVVEEGKGKFDRKGRLGERKPESKMERNRILEVG